MTKPCPPPRTTRQLTLALNAGINRVLSWHQPRTARLNPNPSCTAENVNSAIGLPEDSPHGIGADPFYSWGALFGFISFLEEGYI